MATFHSITCKEALNRVSGKGPYQYDLNAYRGCEHRCVYCFARYSQNYLLPKGEGSFFEDVFIKENIVERLERRLRSRSWKGEIINLGGVTDSYQPIEATRKLMPDILRLLIRYKNPITLSTKSVLPLRDLDLFAELSRLTFVGLDASVTTTDPNLARILEPGAPSPAARLAMLGEFVRHTNASVGVHSMPVIPYITDSDPQLTQLMLATREIGAHYWLPGTLNLRGTATRSAFFRCVGQHFPHAKQPLSVLYADGSLDRDYKVQLYKRIQALSLLHGVSTDYRCQLRQWQEKNRYDQLSLY